MRRLASREHSSIRRVHAACAWSGVRNRASSKSSLLGPLCHLAQHQTPERKLWKVGFERRRRTEQFRSQFAMLPECDRK